MAKFSYNDNISGWSSLGHAAQRLGSGPTHLFSDIVLICCRYIRSDMSISANPINYTTSLYYIFEFGVVYCPFINT